MIDGSQVVEMGHAYPAYYMSPVINADSLNNFKRLKYIALTFENDVKRFAAEHVTPGQPPVNIVGVFQYRNNVSIGMIYGNSQTGEFTEEIYDHDFTEPGEERNNFRESLQGIGVDFQLVVFSTDRTHWSLSGYQVDGDLAGRRYYSGQ